METAPTAEEKKDEMETDPTAEEKKDVMETAPMAGEKKVDEMETAPTEKNRQNDETMADEGSRPAGKKRKATAKEKVQKPEKKEKKEKPEEGEKGNGKQEKNMTTTSSASRRTFFRPMPFWPRDLERISKQNTLGVACQKRVIWAGGFFLQEAFYTLTQRLMRTEQTYHVSKRLFSPWS